jgi:hypothetical protein
VSFKKSRIKTQEILGSPVSKTSYATIQKRNFISGILLGLLGISGVVAVSFATFSGIGDFHFNFTFPFPSGSNLFQTIS